MVSALGGAGIDSSARRKARGDKPASVAYAPIVEQPWRVEEPVPLGAQMLSTLQLAPDALKVRAYVQQLLAQRTPVGS